MEKTYYMIIGGQQTGPYERGELIYAGLTPDTPVWREGLENWVKASSLPELNDLFAAAGAAPQGTFGAAPNPGYGQQPPYPPYGQTYGQQPPYGQPGYPRPDRFGGDPTFMGNGLPIEHTDWLPWAIVATVLGLLTSCIGMIFGILGIVNANKANNFYNIGNRAMGDSANSSARTWTIVALVLAGVGILVTIGLYKVGYFTALSNLSELQNL